MLLVQLRMTTRDKREHTAREIIVISKFPAARSSSTRNLVNQKLVFDCQAQVWGNLLSYITSTCNGNGDLVCRHRASFWFSELYMMKDIKMVLELLL